MVKTFMPSVHEAQLELINRELSERLEGSFHDFIEYFFPIIEGADFIFKDHHEQIIEKLESVVALKILRLVINIPPGYGKTELVIVLFSAWCYAKFPRCRNLHLSYGDDLATNNSVKVKAIIGLKEFQDLWPTQFDKAISGKGHWKTEQGGEFRATATGGMVVGFRAGRLDDEFSGALLIDDPIKAEDAQSSVLRNKINDRLNNTIKSRLMTADTPIVLIMQRIHDDDPAGYLLEGGTGDDYELLNIPVIIDAGTENERALWPEKDPLEYLKSYQLAAPYVFSSQYMGNPVPDDGVFFQRDMFHWYNELPHGEYFGACDYATTDGAGDYTELGVFLVTPDGKIYVVDWWSGQSTSDVWIEQQLDLVDRYKIKRWAGETGPIRNATEPFLKRRMEERKLFFTRDWFSHAVASKEQNARGFQALTSSGRVYLPEGEQWAVELLEQLCRFPMGKFDDKVDTCSLFAKMVNKIWSDEQIIPIEKSEPQGLTLNELIAANKRSKSKQGRNRL